MTFRRSKGLSRTGSLKPRKPRPRKCAAKSCGERFQPFQHGQKVCSPSCALEWGRDQKAKIAEKARAERKRRTKAELEALKSEGEKYRDAIKACDKAFSAFIQARDYGLPCISCDAPYDYRPRRWNCGHYRSRGACPELRYDEDNAHGQCTTCNLHRSGNVVEYRSRLIDRIGEERLARVEGPHPPAHWKVDDLRKMARSFRRRAREIEKQREAA